MSSLSTSRSSDYCRILHNNNVYPSLYQREKAAILAESTEIKGTPLPNTFCSFCRLIALLRVRQRVPAINPKGLAYLLRFLLKLLNRAKLSGSCDPREVGDLPLAPRPGGPRYKTITVETSFPGSRHRQWLRSSNKSSGRDRQQTNYRAKIVVVSPHKTLSEEVWARETVRIPCLPTLESPGLLPSCFVSAFRCETLT